MPLSYTSLMRIVSLSPSRVAFEGIKADMLLGRPMCRRKVPICTTSSSPFLKSPTSPFRMNGIFRTTRLCPVTHNNVDLWAIRTSLDLSKPDSGPVVTERTLRQGDEGTDVKIAQEALNKAGFAITADGKYGSGTAKAVSEFQDKNDLDNDGEIGPATRIKLKL